MICYAKKANDNFRHISTASNALTCPDPKPFECVKFKPELWRIVTKDMSMIIKERHLHVRYSRATMHVHSRTPTLSLPFKGIHPFMHWIDLIYKFYICVPVKCSNNNVNLPAEKFSNCTNPSWRNTKKNQQTTIVMDTVYFRYTVCWHWKIHLALFHIKPLYNKYAIKFTLSA